MKRLERRQYETDDVGKLDTFELMSITKIVGWPGVYNLFSNHGSAYTWYDGEKPVMCGGILVCWQTMGEAWFVGDKAIQLYPYAAWKAAHEQLETDIERFKLLRIQCNVRVDWPEAIHFAEKMGFQRECVMRKAGPFAEDVILYSRVA